METNLSINIKGHILWANNYNKILYPMNRNYIYLQKGFEIQKQHLVKKKK